MTKDTSKTLTIKPSAQLQEKLQELKNYYEQGQKPTLDPAPQKNAISSSKKKASKLQPSQADQKKPADPEAKKAIQGTQKEQREARRKSFLQMKTALDWLMDTYPLCFSKDEPKPLKIRIEKDILANLPSDLSFSRLNIRKAIGYYTHSPKYRQALLVNPDRYDLQGEPVEEVKQEHQQLAQEQLDAYLMRIKAREENKKRFSKKQPTKDKNLQKSSMPEN